MYDDGVGINIGKEMSIFEVDVVFVEDVDDGVAVVVYFGNKLNGIGIVLFDAVFCICIKTGGIDTVA